MIDLLEGDALEAYLFGQFPGNPNLLKRDPAWGQGRTDGDEENRAELKALTISVEHSSYKASDLL